MNKTLIILSLVVLASCGPSAEEKRQVEMEQQRIEQAASEKLAQEKAIRIAAVTCSIMSETRNMDAAIRVREMNDAREKIGAEPFLRGDSAIQEAFEYGLCQELVLNENYDEILQPLKDAKRERERIAREKRAEEQKIAAEKKRLEEDRRRAEEMEEVSFELFVYKIGTFTQKEATALIKKYADIGFPAFTEANKNSDELVDLLIGPFVSEQDIQVNIETLNQISGVTAGKITEWNP